MRIAVTGGSGRIGSAVSELALSQGHSVVSIDRTSLPTGTDQPRRLFVDADITNYDDVARALNGCDAVVHLAAIPSPTGHPEHIVHNNNVVGSYNVLSAAASLGINRVCQASSINATGASYSRLPHFDYLPLDEQHPTYNEDPYSLSKWICEQQADSIARRYEQMSITSLRFHWVVAERALAVARAVERSGPQSKHLWGYTRLDAAAAACLLSLTADFKGHEVLYIVAPTTTMDVASLALQQEFFPDVPVQGDLSNHRGFFDCSKAERLLGWKHPAD